MQGKGHANQYTLYVPQVQVLQDIIDSSACLVGALVCEIHCDTATSFLAVLNPLRLRRPCPFFLYVFLSLFFFLCSLVSVSLQFEQFRTRRGQLRFIDQRWRRACRTCSTCCVGVQKDLGSNWISGLLVPWTAQGWTGLIHHLRQCRNVAGSSLTTGLFGWVSIAQG